MRFWRRRRRWRRRHGAATNCLCDQRRQGVWEHGEVLAGVKFLNTNKIAVFGTLVGDSALPVMGFLDRMHLPLMMRDNILPAYAKQTGGNFDSEFRQRGIEKSFAKIAEEVRTQYTVGYYTHEPFIDGKYRKVEVKVLRPNLTVMAKQGYYPTAEDAKRHWSITPMAQ